MEYAIVIQKKIMMIVKKNVVFLIKLMENVIALNVMNNQVKNALV